LILLDTNVVSELMRDQRTRSRNVAEFLAARPIDELYLPSIVMAELRFGVQRLPDGPRRGQIERDLERFLSAGFAARVLVFDDACARCYAVARATRLQAGRPIAVQDALIGGMALAYGAKLATRNVTDFDGYGLSLVNPWEPEI
jgi:predicted nucleic acid-binding protein